MKRASRRLTALILAVLMLLSSSLYVLPVLASPGAPMKSVTLRPAELPEDGAAGFTTSLYENIWSYDPSADAIVYSGGWSAGCMTAAGYEHFTHINSSNHTWLTRDTTDQWASPAGTIDRGTLQMRAARGLGFATVLGFRAPTSGAVTFSFDRFSSTEGGYFAIFIGQRMVFPTAGLSFAEATDMAAWYAVSPATDMIEINRLLDPVLSTVEEGETISFAFREGSDYFITDPRVTYRTANAPAITSSRFSFKGENYPTYGSNGQHYLINNCGGGWSFGSIPRDGSAPYTPFSCLDPTFCILNKNGTDQWTYGGLYLQNGVVITANHYISIFSYEAPAAGRVSVRVGNITSAKSEGQDILFCILKNDSMIWPQAGGNLQDYSHWFNLTEEGAPSVMQASALSASLRDLRVSAGDSIRYCLVAATGHSMTTKDVDLTVSYISIDSSMPRPASQNTALADCYPLMRAPAEGGGLLAYRGRWQYVAAARGQNDFAPLTKTNGENDLLPGSNKREGYLATSYQGGSAAGLCPGGQYDLAVAYSARYSGRFLLTVPLQDAGAGGTYTVTVEKNGTALFNKTGTVAELGTPTVSMAAKAGDVVYIRVSLPEGETAAAPLYLTPRVTYESMTDRVAITGVSMALSADLTVRFYTAAAVSYFEASEHGLLVWREKQANFDRAESRAEVILAEAAPNNTCCYLYQGLQATEMGDEIYVRPYIKVEGETVYGPVVRFSIFDYATALYGEDTLRNRMVTDLLLYGSAAQRCFSYRTDDLVSDRLSPAQLACGTRVNTLFAAGSQLTPTKGDPILSRLESVSLVLGNGISLRVYAVLDEAEERSAFLEVSSTPDFKNAQKYVLNDEGYATLQTIPVGNTGKRLYIRLVSGAYNRLRYSDTLTYSIEAYIAGTTGKNGPLQDELNAALLNYGNSARAYAYERELGV